MVIITLTITAFFTGCGNSKKPIIIEDYIVGADYEIVEVDDKPAERAESWLLITVRPLVLVSDGTHHLVIRYVNSKDFPRTKSIPENFTISVREGKRYRIVRKNGKPFLIERYYK